jgi:hypothetical protein
MNQALKMSKTTEAVSPVQEDSEEIKALKLRREIVQLEHKTAVAQAKAAEAQAEAISDKWGHIGTAACWIVFWIGLFGGFAYLNALN